jgi:hypothetical protein
VERSQICAAKDEKILDDLLILSCDEDHAICRPFLERGIHLPSNLLFYETNTQEQLLKKKSVEPPILAGVAVYSSEILLNGIVIQKLEYKRSVLV